MPPRKHRLALAASKDSLIERHIDIREIGKIVVQCIAKDTGLSADIILGDSKRHDVVKARFLTSHMISVVSGASSYTIADLVERDPATVRYQVVRSMEWMQGDKSHRDRFLRVRKQVEALQ